MQITYTECVRAPAAFPLLLSSAVYCVCLLYACIYAYMCVCVCVCVSVAISVHIHICVRLAWAPNVPAQNLPAHFSAFSLYYFLLYFPFFPFILLLSPSNYMGVVFKGPLSL